MPLQTFKSVYYPDFPGCQESRKTFKLAFAARESEAYESVRVLSSHEIRSILGYPTFQRLSDAAELEGLALNTFCLRLLRRWTKRRADDGQRVLPGFEDAGAFSTFRNGKTAPLHRWYPYLEGYSPEFVSRVLTRYAAGARRVLDPFAGVGTTPITAALLGVRSFFCELNPLLQFLTAAKSKALALPDRQRQRISYDLRRLSESWRSAVVGCQADRELSSSYRTVFGESRFFADDPYQLVLKARTALDGVCCRDPLLGVFITVAVLGALVPSSNLCRAGDLRFRRDKELDDIGDFLALVTASAQTIADDIEGAARAAIVPVLISGDARRLSGIPSLQVDGVVTSPPYLNGTNYFRNTKVELWFLRALRTQADLAAYRDAAVTAGINDVRGAKHACVVPEVTEIVRTLEAAAYDSRIPKMVGSYFNDIEQVLTAVKKHLRPNATVAIDIGDSVYAKTHVPTDVLLVKVAERAGLELEDSVLLRTRVSRDATALKQVLLIFRSSSSSGIVPVLETPSWNQAWRSFKRDLPHQRPPLSKRNWGHALHSLCSYQGKMKPSLANQLIDVFLPAAGRMLDPFAGVGTIPFEAALRGATTFAFDISPAALAISRAKLGRPRKEEADAVLARLEGFIGRNGVTTGEVREAGKIRFNGSLAEYFHPQTFKEVILARRFFKNNPPQSASESMVMASLLHILHGNRPYALSRRSHPITPFAPTGKREYKHLTSHLRTKIYRSLYATLPEEFREGEVLECDATACWPQHVDKLDAIVTSPPFFDSTRFYLANWMRLWFAGWERTDFGFRPRSFVDELQKESFSIYEPVFRQARERLRPGGVLVLHLGWSHKCDMLLELERVASPWFTVADRFSESVGHCESHGVTDKGTVSKHQFLVLN
jgi:tRNA G10  N-methylase Trm11